ncbi:MAG: ABC transporter permease subunit [Kineosporiaceae bacterium]|nr:ABC transporter permease subunit [Kineosporiaceae bacterium]MBK7621528.1 ABC transporter permease subunit [Kineosporiaceae bacterium]
MSSSVAPPVVPQTPIQPTDLPAPGPRRPGRLVQILGVLVVWIVLWLVLRGTNTLALAEADLTPFHERINDLRDWVDANRNSSPIFLYVFNEIRVVIDALSTALRHLIAVPADGETIPTLGWLGVTAVFTFIAGWLGNIRVALLTAVGFVILGLQGLFTESMDTLAVTLAAVLVSLLIGIPLGVLAGFNDRFNRMITPFLDFMQTMPSFVYLAPLTLFFGIGLSSAVITTVIYAAPPAIRLTAHGIRSVNKATVEASQSLGSTSWQTLTHVLLPMSRRTIVLGINQTIMAALSMVTIAALIDAPGLGKTVIKALQSVDVGTAFNAGIALVILAIVLDRTTTAMAVRSEGVTQKRQFGLAARLAQLRRPMVLAGAVATIVAAYLSRVYVDLAIFPKPASGSPLNLGRLISSGADNATTWVQDTFPTLTSGLQEVTTTWLIDPLQSLLTDSPWWVTAAAITAIAFILGNVRAAIVAALCLVLVVATGLWEDSMITLASTLVATVLVVAFGIVVGVWMGRSRRADAAIRPILDAAQVLPPFVYLVPVVALFNPSRFSAIIAALVFAAPVAVKITADGIRHVSATTVEAAVAAGSSTSQVVRKVQLPMAAPALTLATNQGLIYVLSMVVMGGLVGGGALGYDVVAGFSQGQLYGKGLAAGLAIVLLGITLDRVTQAASRRVGRPGR